MATQSQIASAQKALGVARNMVVTLKALPAQNTGLFTGWNALVTAYNALTAPQKTAFLAIVNLDQTEFESNITAINNIQTSLGNITSAINALPSVDPTF